MSEKTKQTVHDVITQRFIDFIETNQQLPWHKPWAVADGVQQNYQTRRPYNGVNAFLTGMSGFNTPYWLTEKQIKAMGGRIKRDQYKKYTPIVWWCTFGNKKKKKGEDTTNTENEEDEEDDNKKKFRGGRHLFYQVYNLEQTEGIEYEVPEIVVDPNKSPIELAEKVIGAMPNPPQFETGGGSAYYSPSMDLVKVPPLKNFDTAEYYYSVVFHELAHSTGHKSRVGRDLGNGFGSVKYSKEELIAEIASSFVLNELGIGNVDTERNSFAYVQSWLRHLQDNPQWIITASNASVRAADYIMGRYEY